MKDKEPRHDGLPNDEQHSTNMNRRDVLQSIGAAGIGISGAASGANLLDGFNLIGEASAAGNNPSRSIKISGNGSRTDYSFTVNGLLEADNINSHDNISGGTASGHVGGGYDSYNFSGEFISFDFDGDADIYIDGEVQGSPPAPTQGITISGNGNLSEYDFSVTGMLEPSSFGNLEGGDTISGSNATGSVNNSESDTYEFSGELIYFNQTGNADVYYNDDISNFDYTKINPEDHMLNNASPSEVKVHSLTSTETYYGFRINGEGVPGEQADSSDSLSDNYTTATVTSGDVDNYYIGGYIEFFTLLEGIQIKPESPGRNEPKIVIQGESSAPNRGIDYTLRTEGTWTEVNTNSSVTVNNDSSGVSTASGTVYANEEQVFRYSGDLEDFQVDNKMRVEPFYDSQRESAVASKKTQMGAEMERLDEFQPLANQAKQNGRIRRDPDGIDAAYIPGTVFPKKVVERDLVVFNLADVSNADIGTMPLARNLETGTIRSSMLTYKWKTSDDIVKSMDIYMNNSSGGLSQKNINLDVETIRSVRDQYSTANFDFFNKPGEFIAGISKDLLFEAEDQLAEAIDNGNISKAWKARIKGFDTVYELAESGLLQQAADEDENVSTCEGCVFVSGQLCEVGCGIGGDAACALLGITGIAGVGCIVVLSTICSIVVDGVQCSEALARRICREEPFEVC